VYIVPDGPIHFVAFDALPDTGGRYLAETGPIFHTLSAERDLVPDGGVLPRGDGLLAIGGPDFDRAGATPQLAALAAPPRATRAPDCGDLATIRFEPLPASLLEAEEVAARWHAGVGATRPPEALCLTGADATESAFKERAPGRRVLHLATHAFVLSDSCGEAASAGGTRGVGGLAAARAAPWRFAPTRDPLLQAGLAVAGANGRRAARAEDEDGILLAAEIAAMDLSGVDWAVLSACDTGLGEIRLSEGVLGLRRAFQVAGVRTLIMSLWGVDDEETRAWMRALYAARFARGLSTAPALRAASLERLAERRAEGRSTHPFYWGGFVAVGDWN
jgi:CHAT domain-containing protein